MCDVIDFPGEPPSRQLFFGVGDIESEVYFSQEDTLWLNPSFWELGGKCLCKHPNTEFHEMELKPGEGLRCPAETVVKLVLPKPLTPEMIPK